MTTNQIRSNFGDNRRTPNKSLADDVKGLLARSVREGISLERMQLRETGAARAALIDLARDEFARLAGITIKQRALKADDPQLVEGVINPNQEQERPFERINALVVQAVDALPEGKRTVHGKVRTGEEIARAIPDAEAFLAEVALMEQGTFFELNEKGQLVMMDGCDEPCSSGSNFPNAQVYQKRLVYRDDAGNIKVIERVNFTVDKATGNYLLPNNSGRIAASLVLMERGLPTLTKQEDCHIGEYVRMNEIFRFDRASYIWVEDPTIIDPLHARYATWDDEIDGVSSRVVSWTGPYDSTKSRCVLRVNLNLEP